MYINPHNSLSAAEDSKTRRILEILISNGTEMHVAAGEKVIRQGQLCDFFFVVLSGSFRAYRYVNDKETIIGFSFKGDVDTAPYAFINKTHSTEYIEAVVPSVIVKIYRSRLEQLSTEHAELKSFMATLLSHYIEILVQRFIEFKACTAEELYLRLHSRQPNEVKKIPLKFIASYLGITQERLSRIRKKHLLLT
jgi:CRP-like cAMP-binding protein